MRLHSIRLRKITFLQGQTNGGTGENREREADGNPLTMRGRFLNLSVYAYDNPIELPIGTSHIDFLLSIRRIDGDSACISFW